MSHEKIKNYYEKLFNPYKLKLEVHWSVLYSYQLINTFLLLLSLQHIAFLLRYCRNNLQLNWKL